jgi:triosephosphate isomerase
MTKPILLVNFKTYEQGTGENAIRLAKMMDNISKEHTNVETIIALQPTDIHNVRQAAISLTLYAQHIDPVQFGSNTGWILPEAVKQAGASGTLISHSEHMLEFKEIEKRVLAAKKLGLKTIICAPTPGFAEAVARLSPDFIALEAPELIGGPVSVSRARPEIISDAVKAVQKANPNVRVLCGAGVQDGQDVKKALELGTHGILIAAAVMKSPDPKKVVEDLIQGYRGFQPQLRD